MIIKQSLTDSKNRSIVIRQINLIIVLLTVASTIFAAPPRKVKIGDAINITVSGHPEFSRNVLVFGDGTTDYPLLAGIPVDGLTASEMKDLLRPVLMRYDLEPEIFIIIAQARTIRFQVYGEVQKPGQYNIQGTLNLQHAIAMAGGPTEKGDYRRIKIFRTVNDQKLTINIDFEDYFHSDSLFIAPEIQPEDVIVIPTIEWRNSVRIFGLVQNPGIYILSPNDNILDIVQKTGGFLEGADKKRIIHIIQKDEHTERHVYNLQETLENENYINIPPVNPGDIIIIQKIDEWRSFWYWVDKSRNILYLVTAILLIDSRY